MAQINNNITINNMTIKNRIVMPPLVMFLHKREDGFLSEDDYIHYRKRAKHETGLIVVEASAIDINGRSFESELGIWDDKYIAQFRKLTDICHVYGAVMFIQLHHGGFKTNPALAAPVSASEYILEDIKATKMTIAEIDACVINFAKAAKRAELAGFDGIELHGCHGFLINQFACSNINKRTDKYSPSSAFGSAIIKKIKEYCSDKFIISIRVGINIPHIENSLNTAVEYVKAGAHLLSVSQGISSEPIKTPDDWQFSDISYLAQLVKQEVDVPVVGVYGINNADIANSLLSGNHCDMTAVGRGHLINADWADKSLARGKVSECYDCKKCYFFGNKDSCPAVDIG